MHQPSYAPVPEGPPGSRSPRPQPPHSSSAGLLSSSESEPRHSEAFVKNPAIIYVELLLFFVVMFTFPLTFLIILSNRDGIPAPPSLANFAISSSRLTSQLAALLSSSITSSVKWALAGVVTIRAQKHFCRIRPIHKIEVYSALKNGGLAWSWKTRPWMVFWTSVVVVLCGFLTSGFVALISPLPFKTTKVIGPGRLTELNLSSTDPDCAQWYSDVMHNATLCRTITKYQTSNLVYSTCLTLDPLGDFLAAAKSSMMRRISSLLPDHDQEGYIFSSTQLGNTHIAGGTAGTLPIGPAGVSVFSKRFPRITKPSLSYDYTLSLEGLWSNVSCAYDDGAQSMMSFRNKSGVTYHDLTCPTDQESILAGPISLGNPHNGVLIAGSCLNKNQDNITFYLQSYWNSEYHQALSGKPPEPSDSRYGGIGGMNCTLLARTSALDAIYRANRTAFNMVTPSSGFTSFTGMTNLTGTATRRGIIQALSPISLGQTDWNGNTFAETVLSVAMSYGNVGDHVKDPLIPTLVAYALKGAFEYGVTRQRLILTGDESRPNNTHCLRDVTGELVEKLIGWDFKRTTALGLIPLMIISLACIGVTIWTMLRRDQLTVFDPTSPVSLLAAASDGKLRFSGEKEVSLIGDPEDEFVMNTKVRYGYYGGRWGLKAE